MSWFTASIICLFMFGLWGFFPKISGQYVTAKQALPYEISGAVLVGIFFVIYYGVETKISGKGISFAFLTGICGTLGSFFYFYAARQGSLSLTVTLTALYPIITIFLSLIFLDEKITIKQFIGVGFALLAIYFISSDS